MPDFGGGEGFGGKETGEGSPRQRRLNFGSGADRGEAAPHEPEEPGKKEDEEEEKREEGEEGSEL